MYCHLSNRETVSRQACTWYLCRGTVVPSFVIWTKYKTISPSVDNAICFNVQIFPKRGKGDLLSVARYERGGKAIYCLSCLISLIEQVCLSHWYTLAIKFPFLANLRALFIFSLFYSHDTFSSVTVLWNGDGAGICNPLFLYLEAIIGASYWLILVQYFLSKWFKDLL